jgi:CRISPR-associated endonuclease Csn1
VTNAALKKYLLLVGYGKDIQITGVDGDFKANLKSFRDLEFVDLPYSDKEEIIKAITIFGDDKKLLKRRLKNKYGNKLSNENIAKISKLKYTGWSKLSKKFLTGIEAMLKNGTAEVTNIIRALWETNDNLMQLLSDNYDFRKKIDEENRNIESTSLKQEIDNLYVSPKIKRPIYQTMQILDEIVKIQGNEPKKIFIEVARGEEKKERKVSRKQRLLDLYKYCKNDEKELYQQLINTDESEFKRDALYLYYTQFGRCMYTNQKIDISEIYNKNLYDIDHIRVLVTKKSNEDKGNIYPINQTVRDRMIPYWKMLFSKELISKQKYERLVRNSMLTDEELSSFVARQLVETRQSTKAVYQLLRKRYPSTKIECIKAGLVSDFRRDFDMLKCRDVNDYHHAKDSY